MADPITKVVQAANQTAKTADTLGQRFARELGQVLRDTERRLRPLIVDVAEGSRTAIVKAAQANRVRVAIGSALRAAGYDTLAETAYGDRLDAVVQDVLATRRLAQASARLSGAFDARVAALRTLHETDLLDEGAAVARELWQATVRGVFGSRSVQAILGDLGEVIDATAPTIQTLYDTSISVYGRQVEALQAGDDPDTPFAYLGPADDRTRDFCLEHVGKVYTRAEIDELDNGQLDNVFLTGGGYNCRHTWIEVSRFSELRDLVGTDNRVPEIQDALTALDAAA